MLHPAPQGSSCVRVCGIVDPLSIFESIHRFIFPMVDTDSDGSDSDDEEYMVYLKAMKISTETIKKFKSSGFKEWTSQNGGGIVQTAPEIWEELGIALGDRQRLKSGFQHYRDGTFMQHYMNLPRGNTKFGSEIYIDPDSLKGSDGSFFESWKLRIHLVATVLILISSLYNENMQSGLVAEVALVILHYFVPAREFVVTAVLSILGVWLPTLASMMAPASCALVALAVAWCSAVAVGDCVDGDTKVLTVERKHVPIRSLKSGDLILSYTNKKYVVRPVMKVMRTSAVTAERMCRISFAGAQDIIATRNHPFFVKGKKWSAVSPEHQNAVKAAQLEVGDICVDMDGRAVKVTAIKDLPPNATKDVYNILIENSGTWFANGVLCHSGIQAVIGKENVANA